MHPSGCYSSSDYVNCHSMQGHHRPQEKKLQIILNWRWTIIIPLATTVWHECNDFTAYISYRCIN